MRQFAEGTAVSVEKSRAEIESLLMRYGCRDFGYRIVEKGAVINFVVKDRHVRFCMALPSRDDAKFTYKLVRGFRKAQTNDQKFKAWDQECRRLWRCLALSIKAKLETVQSGIAVFEDEFLANIVDPLTGKTVSEIIRPQLDLRQQLALPAPKDDESTNSQERG